MWRGGGDPTAPHPQALQPLRYNAVLPAGWAPRPGKGLAGRLPAPRPGLLRSPRGDRLPGGRGRRSPGPPAPQNGGGEGDLLRTRVPAAPLKREVRARHRASSGRALAAGRRPRCPRVTPPHGRAFLPWGGGRGRTPRPRNKGRHRPPAALPGCGLRAEKRPRDAANGRARRWGASAGPRRHLDGQPPRRARPGLLRGTPRCKKALGARLNASSA